LSVIVNVTACPGRGLGVFQDMASTAGSEEEELSRALPEPLRRDPDCVTCPVCEEQPARNAAQSTARTVRREEWMVGIRREF
jgi:hypothetical protein